jgi:MFS family permease
MVALMPTATSLPFFLIALPAGALADIVDRRRLLLVSQAWMLIAAALLGWLALQGLMTDWLLLWLTIALSSAPR